MTTENKQNLTVNLEVKEIMFDISNKAYLTGRAREAEKSKDYEAASNMQASGDTEDNYQLTRSVANHFSSVKSIMGEYLDEKTTTTDNLINTVIESGGKLTLAFKLPSNYNSASADSLGKGIHAFIVNKSLFDWFTITNKQDAADYDKLANDALETARQALYKRSRPERPTYTNS